MKLRTLVGGAVGGVGLATVVNRVLAARSGDLEPPFDGKTGTYRWRGFDVAYTEAGDPDDPDLCCLHGISLAGSSHEFADIVDALAEDYHVVAPDLPGFGRSERHPLLYSGSLYCTFVEDFLRDLTDEPTVLASSLSGAYAAVAAESEPVAELLLVCPTADTMPGRRTWLRTLFRTPVVGQALYNVLASKASIRHFNADHGFHDPAKLTDERLAYQWRTAHQPGARFAVASFIAGFLDVDVALGTVLSAVDAPVTLVWGRESELSPLSEGKALAEAADARLIVFDEADLQPHVEHPDQFVHQVVHGHAMNETSMTDIEITETGGSDAEDATAEDT
jgi:pimeloyl-ACP methyl ester carboxylesterase